MSDACRKEWGACPVQYSRVGKAPHRCVRPADHATCFCACGAAGTPPTAQPMSRYCPDCGVDRWQSIDPCIVPLGQVGALGVPSPEKASDGPATPTDPSPHSTAEDYLVLERLVEALGHEVCRMSRSVSPAWNAAVMHMARLRQIAGRGVR